MGEANFEGRMPRGDGTWGGLGKMGRGFCRAETGKRTGEKDGGIEE